MDEWSIYALGAVTALCLLPPFLVLLCLGSYLILLEIKYKSRIRRRAQHDYRTARGTQHLRQLRACLPTLQSSMRTRRSRIQYLERQLELTESKRSKELRSALSEHLVNTRLTDVSGVGPKLSKRIIRVCFRGALRDLLHADRVAGVGSRRRGDIAAWVREMEARFPILLAGDFPNKQCIMDAHSEKLSSLQNALESAQTALSNEESLYETAHTMVQRFQEVKPGHFRKALRRSNPQPPVPGWYLNGVYPPWQLMPEWFETLLGEYGG